jgi:hypothetical protein
MPLISDDAKLVIRRTVTFEYSVLDQHYVDYTPTEILEREKQTPFSTWARQTDVEIMQDKFEIIWDRDKPRFDPVIGSL